MADTQGKFCKAEAKSVCEAMNEVLKALPKKKQMEFIGHFNDLFLFLAAAERAAPEKAAD
jgi:hypothetical protein